MGKNESDVLKVIGYFVLTAILISYLVSWYKMFYLANFWAHAELLIAILYGASPLLAIWLYVLAFKWIRKQ